MLINICFIGIGLLNFVFSSIFGPIYGKMAKMSGNWQCNGRKLATARGNWQKSMINGTNYFA